MPHTDSCSKSHADMSIESSFLEKILSKMNDISDGLVLNNIIQEDYILDIDLDYFMSQKSINPNDTKVFYSLIKNSKAITIAREPKCIELCKLRDEKIDDEYLLDILLNHIKIALS